MIEKDRNIFLGFQKNTISKNKKSSRVEFEHKDPPYRIVLFSQNQFIENCDWFQITVLLRIKASLLIKIQI